MDYELYISGNEKISDAEQIREMIFIDVGKAVLRIIRYERHLQEE